MTDYEAGVIEYNKMTVAERISIAVPVQRQTEIMRAMENGTITRAHARLIVMQLRERFIERLGKAHNERTGANK